MKYSVKWLEVILYTAKFPITFHLWNNFVYVIINRWHFHDNGSSYEKYYLSLRSSYEDFPSIHAPTFPNSFCIPSLTSDLFCLPLPLPHCSFNIFIFKFLMVTDYNAVLSIAHSYTEQKANFQTPRPSVSITVSVPYLWSAQLSNSLHLRPQFYAVKLAPAQE